MVKDESQFIEAERRAQLEALARIVVDLGERATVPMIFICTHNSRRSHISQIMAQVAAREAGFEDIETYSGGTEVTAFHPNALAALERRGFRVEVETPGDNPVYALRQGADDHVIHCFSKLAGDEANPQEGYIAVMTCSSASEQCPALDGAVARVSILFEDPGKFDGTPGEAQAYDECCARIGREMRYLFRHAAELRG
jgi:arsenate reductase (thioredoxin)